MQILEKLTSYIEENKKSLFGTFEHLHQIPEPAFKEKKTAAYLARQLEHCGYLVKSGIGGTGVLGIWNAENAGPVVGIRADMDALVHEIDGIKTPLHSCGHDANCTAALWAAQAIAHCGGPQKGELRILFQPAEEVLGGALAVLDTHVLDGLEYFISTHLFPKQYIPMGKVSPSLRHGASGVMLAEITGESAHASRPHLGINAAEVSAAIIGAINAVHMDPIIPHSVKVTMIQSGGTAFNMIPPKAQMAFDLRAQTNESMQILREKVQETIIETARSMKAKADCSWSRGAPAAKENKEILRFAEKAIISILGQEGLAPGIDSSGSEDFHNYACAIPGLKATILGIGADLTPGLHHETMTFNHEAIVTVAKILAVMATEIFSGNDAYLSVS